MNERFPDCMKILKAFGSGDLMAEAWRTFCPQCNHLKDGCFILSRLETFAPQGEAGELIVERLRQIRDQGKEEVP